MTSGESESKAADAWLSAELNRIWLLAERTLRSLQADQLKPQGPHSSMAEIESILTARRVARLGAKAAPEDEAALNKAIAAIDATLPELRKAAPLGRIISNLGLRPLEVETLVTAMAPHIDSVLADVFNVVKSPAGGRKGVDLSLVAQLFRLKRADRVALLDAVDPDRPLLRWRVLQAGPVDSLESFGSVTHRIIKPTFDLLSALCGRGQLAPELSRCAELIRAEPTLDDLRLDPKAREEALAMCTAARNASKSKTASEPLWIVLWGPDGVGKKTLAARLAAFGGQALVALNPSVIDRPTLDELMPRVLREALIHGAMLYIGPVPAELLEKGARELTRRLKDYPEPLILGVPEATPPRIAGERPLWELQVRIPLEPTRLQIWNDCLPEPLRGPDLQLPILARAFNLTPGEIIRSCSEVRTLIKREGDRKATHQDVRNGIERRLRSDLGDLARRVEVTVKWEDLVLSQQDLDRVREFISRKKYFHRVYNDWGYGRRLGYGRGVIGLVSGPPGTGKTMLAGLIAKALDLDLYQVDLAQVVWKWVGETEKQLGKVFDQAERAHAVLMFDEADSLFSKRTEVKSSNDRYANLAVNYLLQRLEQYTGVAILTTNRPASLDEALQRRLTLHLHLEIPEAPERERLWRSFIPTEAPMGAEIDFFQLAKHFELSGGYIKNAAVRAAFMAAANESSIGMELLQLASSLELEDMGRVIRRGNEEAARGDFSGEQYNFTDT